ncbi:hypothetical protein BD413DRAFT_557153 [Trametes elegans]|nr:hypothetical protein BD413DRAFT_557153 [Trametes elegans]
MYDSFHAVRQHARSGTHAVKVFRCSAKFGCGARFVKLSAVCQHVESGKCGIRTFRGKVDNLLADLLD